MGVNAMMFHAGTNNPWVTVHPGITFGMWGTQFTPEQTWWQVGAKPFISYLSRCQAMLQQGLHVADVCFLMDDKHMEPARRIRGRCLWDDVLHETDEHQWP